MSLFTEAGELSMVGKIGNRIYGVLCMKHNMHWKVVVLKYSQACIDSYELWDLSYPQDLVIFSSKFSSSVRLRNWIVLFKQCFPGSSSICSSMSYSINVSVSIPKTSNISGCAEPCTTAHRLPVIIIIISRQLANRNCAQEWKVFYVKSVNLVKIGWIWWKSVWLYQLKEPNPDGWLFFLVLRAEKETDKRVRLASTKTLHQQKQTKLTFWCLLMSTLS